jgi:carboxylate-amine ligase
MAGMPDWARWNATRDDYTVGVEDEVMLVDPGDWNLDQSFSELRPLLGADLAERLSPETHAATIEFETAPAATAGEAAAEFASIRRRLSVELAALGRAAAASGTHPLARWEDTEISPERRYRYLHHEMRELARREPTFAMHVHVAIGDPELAVKTLNRMRVHLPLLLGLSAISPYWQGRDSGMASSRTPIFETFPRSGIPRAFGGYGEYVDALDTLIACGAFPEPGFIWWDLRLQPALGTLEVRVMDSQPEPWRAAPLIALTQSLVRFEALEDHAPPELRDAPELLEESRFRAARDGVRAELLDPVGRRALPLGEVAALAVEAVRRHARELGCEEELDQVARLIDQPADELQRGLAGPEGQLEPVVAGLAERFAGDRPERVLRSAQGEHIEQR